MKSREGDLTGEISLLLVVDLRCPAAVPRSNIIRAVRMVYSHFSASGDR